MQPPPLVSVVVPAAPPVGVITRFGIDPRGGTNLWRRDPLWQRNELIVPDLPPANPAFLNRNSSLTQDQMRAMMQSLNVSQLTNLLISANIAPPRMGSAYTAKEDYILRGLEYHHRLRPYLP